MISLKFDKMILFFKWDTTTTAKLFLIISGNFIKVSSLFFKMIRIVLLDEFRIKFMIQICWNEFIYEDQNRS